MKMLCWRLKYSTGIFHGVLRVGVRLSQHLSDTCRVSFMRESACACIIHVGLCVFGAVQRCLWVCFNSSEGYKMLLGRPGLQLSGGGCRSRDSITLLTLCLCSSAGGGCRTPLWIWMNKRSLRSNCTWPTQFSENYRKQFLNHLKNKTPRRADKRPILVHS